MQTTVGLILSGLSLGIALSGACALATGQSAAREKVRLGLVYGCFAALLLLPMVEAFGSGFYLFYLPFMLVVLLSLPPAMYHYVIVKTAGASTHRPPWRDLVLPLVADLVCVGFWTLPNDHKTTLFVAGELPEGYLPAVLSLITFGLIACWMVASFLYLAAILRRLATYRADIRQLYSNVDQRDLRWVDWVMALLVMIWAAGAISLAGDNYGGGAMVAQEVVFALTAACLLVLNVFAAQTPPVSKPEEFSDPQDAKYARSALTADHATKLAERIDTAMKKDALYLDPNLSLQKLSHHIRALPNQVSQTLNQEIGTSFFDYVARWRIEASKPLILAGEASVLTIALDVGFNSKSTFYKAFKRETGVTPKEYRASGAEPGR